MKRLHYSWAALGGDLAGGAAAALIALPYGLAMASLMGLPPMTGIFTSVITGLITGLLGRNAVLIGGTASATVPFIAAAVKHGGVGGAAKVSIVAAVFMMAFCILRLGRHIRLVPPCVVAGFSCGIGAMMAISQYDQLIGSAGWGATFIGLLTIVVALACARFTPRLPAPLMAVLAAMAAAAIFQLPVKQLGPQSLTIPPFAGFAWTPGDVYTVLPSALALAFAASLNILITSRVVDHFRGRHKPMRPSDADGELGVYGIVNLCAGMFGAPVSAGIPARSVASLRCGATTRVSNLAHAGFLLLFVAAGSRLIAHVPAASLAGVTAWTGICLLDWSFWRRLPHMKRLDASAFLVTAAGVATINAAFAVLAGCAIFGAAALYRRRDALTPVQDLLSVFTPYVPSRHTGSDDMR